MQQDVIERLFSIEDSISSAFSGDLFALKEFLGFHWEYTHLNHLSLGLHANSGISFESLSTKTKNMLKWLFVAYRVVDVAGALVSYPENPQKYEKSSDFQMQIQVRTLFPFENQHLLRVLQHFEQLEHWPSVLTSFRFAQQPSLISKGKFFRKRFSKPTHSGSKIPDGLQRGSSRANKYPIGSYIHTSNGNRGKCTNANKHCHQRTNQ